MEPDRTRARVFGEVAQEYDRVRPGYPAALVDDVLAYADLDGASALEVGAGTGKATAAFAARGIPITAVEPDPAMAAVLAAKLRDQPRVTVAVSSFEDYRPDRRFGLLFSGQAWHWTDPALRWQRTAEALAPGGAVALFWNADYIGDPDLAAGIVAAHREHAPEIWVPTEPVDRSTLATYRPEPDEVNQPLFGDRTERLYRSTRSLSTADYVATLSTQSAYRVLDPEVRERLFAAVTARSGDRVVLEVATILYLCRRQ